MSAATDDFSRPDHRFNTARAKAAILGATLYQVENDYGDTVYIISRWALTRELHDIDAVERWLDRAGAK